MFYTNVEIFFTHTVLTHESPIKVLLGPRFLRRTVPRQRSGLVNTAYRPRGTNDRLISFFLFRAFITAEFPTDWRGAELSRFCLEPAKPERGNLVSPGAASQKEDELEENLRQGPRGKDKKRRSTRIREYIFQGLFWTASRAEWTLIAD